jgi:hypothetical protein
MRSQLLLLSAGALLVGCAPQSGGDAAVKGKVIFDTASGLTFKNHVEVTADPAGGAGQVFATADEHKKMTFVNGQGFFAVPAGHAGRVSLRLYAVGVPRLRIAVVGEKKHKSFYVKPPAEGSWFDLDLELAECRDRIAEGEQVKDITIWIKPLEQGGKVPTESRLYCAGGTFSDR